MKKTMTICANAFWALWALWILLSFVVLFTKHVFFGTGNYPHSLFEFLVFPEISDSHSPLLQAPTLTHLWGTDDLGRDVLSRLLFGSAFSLAFGLIVALFTCALGFFVGLALICFPLRVQIAGGFLIELLSSLPLLPLALIGLSFYPGQVVIVAFLKIVLGWGNVAQFTQMEARSQLFSSRLAAAKSQGLSSLRIVFKHLMPGLLPGAVTFIPQVAFSSILSLATLDFFGLGFPIPTPTLSEMFHQYAENQSAWWLLFYPLVVITGLLLGFQRLERKVH